MWLALTSSQGSPTLAVRARGRGDESTTSRIQRYTFPRMQWRDKPPPAFRLSIEDPFETHDCVLPHDIGRTLNEKTMARLRQSWTECLEAAKRLSG